MTQPDNVSWFAFMAKALTEQFEAVSPAVHLIAVNWLNISIVLWVAWFAADRCILHRFNRAHFSKIVLRILFVSIVVHGWNTPIPGVGRSAPHIIIDHTNYLAKKLDDGMHEKLRKKLDDSYVGWERPELFTPISETVYYIALTVLIFVLQAVILAVTGIGYVAVALGDLFGSMAVVTLLWPPLEHIFRGWLNAFIQYSYYKVFAAATTFIVATALIGIFDATPGGLTLEQMGVVGVKLISILIVAIYFTTQVPSVCASYFAGRSGEGMVNMRKV